MVFLLPVISLPDGTIGPLEEVSAPLALAKKSGFLCHKWIEPAAGHMTTVVNFLQQTRGIREKLRVPVEVAPLDVVSFDCIAMTGYSAVQLVCLHT
jgi:hypothetical protein